MTITQGYDSTMLTFPRGKNADGKYEYKVMYGDQELGKFPASKVNGGWYEATIVSPDMNGVLTRRGSDINTLKQEVADAISGNFEYIMGVILPKSEDEVNEPMTMVQDAPDKVDEQAGAISGSIADVTPAPEPAPAPEPEPEPVPASAPAKADAKAKAPATTTKKEPPKAMLCLCGCGEYAKPGSRFLPGHDARVKGQLSRATRAKTDEDYTGTGVDLRLPKVLVDRAKADPTLVVAGYDAATILDLAKDYKTYTTK